MFASTKNQNEGTCGGFPVPKTGTRVLSHVPWFQNLNRNEVTFAKTTLLRNLCSSRNLVASNLVVCNFYDARPLLHPFALFCVLAFALFCTHLRSFALICVFLCPAAFRTIAFGNFRFPGSFRVPDTNSGEFWKFSETQNVLVLSGTGDSQRDSRESIRVMIRN